ncbi:Erythroid membrane-associated protein [Folsomia candida]|uniref:Erythroid membrane-associated protein n=2 Tax=Folsomia candida TaxID=158441 RepID=A0A226CZJ6_FOLCA|nr:Erythroid membrane-associated protein [Folsomia candida]
MRPYLYFILVYTFALYSKTSGFDNDLQQAFEIAHSNFDPEATDDCSPKETLKTLKFLRLNSSRLKDQGLKEDESGFPVDCSLRKTNLGKLRHFLLEKGFLQNLGSLHLINYQDTNLKLHCNPSDEYMWRSRGLGEKDAEDDEFQKKGHSGSNLNIVSPQGYLYFRKYICFSKKCTHTFYVVTRPHPKLDFPLQANEHEKFAFKCTINPCTTTSCELGGKSNKPRPQHPYNMKLRVPLSVFKNKTYAKGIAEKYGCDDEKGVRVKEPIYLTMTNDSGDALYGAWNANGTMEAMTAVAKKTSSDSTKLFYINVDITDVSDNHRGDYECLVIDGNGIPSTPTVHSLHKYKRFSGKGKLHVRKVIMTIIPGVIVGAILVLMCIVWIAFRKRDKMEYDDGTPYAKQELVSPAEEQKDAKV